jgi:prepilin-type N-terminal cleavage/methylation domain-containing protein
MGYTKRSGFTLVELLIVVAIMGVLSAAAAMTVSLVMKTSTTAMEQNRELGEVHMVGSWISRDMKNAVEILETTELCSMQCDVWDDTAQGFLPGHENVEYRIEDGVLKRKNWPQDNPALVETITVAQFINAADTTFMPEPGDVSGKFYKLAVTADYNESVPGSVTRVYKIKRGY